MRKRQSSRKTREIPQETLDEFQAYGEYNYSYQHEERDWDGDAPEEDEAARRRAQAVRRAQRIPLEKEPPQRRGHTILVRLVFLLICAVVALVVLQETVFRLKTVYVIGNETKPPQEIAAISGLVKGLNIFAVSEEEVRRNLSKDHTIEFLRMQKEYPDKIYLYVNERKSIAAFQWNGMQYTLDEQGIVMSESSSLLLPEGMPVITGFQVASVQVGQKLGTKDAKQLTAYTSVMMELRLQMYSNQISELNLSDSDNLYLMTVDGITVRLGSQEHARAKVGALRTDMAYLKQLGKSNGILDVSIPEDAKYTPER